MHPRPASATTSCVTEPITSLTGSIQAEAADPREGGEETLPRTALDGAARLNPRFWGPGS